MSEAEAGSGADKTPGEVAREASSKISEGVLDHPSTSRAFQGPAKPTIRLAKFAVDPEQNISWPSSQGDVEREPIFVDVNNTEQQQRHDEDENKLSTPASGKSTIDDIIDKMVRIQSLGSFPFFRYEKDSIYYLKYLDRQRLDEEYHIFTSVTVDVKMFIHKSKFGQVGIIDIDSWKNVRFEYLKNQARLLFGRSPKETEILVATPNSATDLQFALKYHKNFLLRMSTMTEIKNEYRHVGHFSNSFSRYGAIKHSLLNSYHTQELFGCDWIIELFTPAATRDRLERIKSILPNKNNSIDFTNVAAKIEKEAYDEVIKSKRQTVFTPDFSDFKKSKIWDKYFEAASLFEKYEACVKRKLKDHFERIVVVQTAPAPTEVTYLKPYSCPFDPCSKTFTINSRNDIVFMSEHVNNTHLSVSVLDLQLSKVSQLYRSVLDVSSTCPLPQCPASLDRLTLSHYQEHHKLEAFCFFLFSCKANVDSNLLSDIRNVISADQLELIDKFLRATKSIPEQGAGPVITNVVSLQTPQTRNDIEVINIGDSDERVSSSEGASEFLNPVVSTFSCTSCYSHKFRSLLGAREVERHCNDSNLNMHSILCKSCNEVFSLDKSSHVLSIVTNHICSENHLTRHFGSKSVEDKGPPSSVELSETCVLCQDSNMSLSHPHNTKQHSEHLQVLQAYFSYCSINGTLPFGIAQKLEDLIFFFQILHFQVPTISNCREIAYTLLQHYLEYVEVKTEKYGIVKKRFNKVELSELLSTVDPDVHYQSICFGCSKAFSSHTMMEAHLNSRLHKCNLTFRCRKIVKCLKCMKMLTHSSFLQKSHLTGCKLKSLKQIPSPSVRTEQPVDIDIADELSFNRTLEKVQEEKASASNFSKRKTSIEDDLRAPKRSRTTGVTEDYYYFCLDCESHFTSPSDCSHLTHPRVPLGMDIADHVTRTGHSNFQPVTEFVKPVKEGGLLSLHNLSYSKAWGSRVRKCWKRMVLSGERLFKMELIFFISDFF